MSNNFRPPARLHRPTEYVAAFKGKRIARGALFVIYSPRKITTPEPKSRLGMVIGKRYAKLSVCRNAIKRVIRESYRLHRDELPPKDLVFRLIKPIPKTSLTQLKKIVRAEADELLNRLI